MPPKLIDRKDLPNIGRSLAGLDKRPPRRKASPQVSTIEAIRVLRPQIERALRKNYTYEEIAKHLQTQGIDIKPRTLSRNLWQIRKEADQQPAPAEPKRTP